MSDLHARLMRHYLESKQLLSAQRMEMLVDAEFYDGNQYSREELEILRNRGQSPLVVNKIKPAVDWVLGTQRRTRVDWKVLARRKDETKSAETKTALLKYINDSNDADQAQSRAFREAVIVGLGWLEEGVRSDDTEEPIYYRSESWRNMWHDPLSIEDDLSDARYVIRVKHLDHDVATALWPNAADILHRATNTFRGIEDELDDSIYPLQHVGGMDYQMPASLLHYANASPTEVAPHRQRVKILEVWYKQPTTKKVLRGNGGLNGLGFNPEQHQSSVDNGVYSLYDSTVNETRLCIMTDFAILNDTPSPYAHNRFPFTPVWCYRSEGRLRYAYGIVRNIRGVQEDLNKRMSKSLHILSTRQIVADVDAATDWYEIADQAANPAGIILLDGTKNAKFEMRTDNALAGQHIDLMNLDAKHIQDVSGITDENLGRDSNALSGKAVTARQEQGNIVTTEIFDRFRAALKTSGEKMLSLIEQFMSEERMIRITGDRGQADYISINEPVFDPQTGAWVIQNDMVATKADFIIDQVDFRATQRAAMMDDLMAMMQKMPPEIALNMLDLVIDSSDMPGREELVARIRKLNGQTDPNSEQTPEDANNQQAIQQRQQAQQALEQQKAELEIELLKAQVKRTNAEAIGKNVDSAYAAMEAGQIAAAMPEVAPLGDGILQSSGWQDANGAPVMPSQSDSQPTAQPAAPHPEIRKNTHPEFPGRIPPYDHALNPHLTSTPQAPSPTGMRAGIETPQNDGVHV